MKNKLLSVIKELANEQTSQTLHLGEIYRKAGIDQQLMYDLLDQLEQDGHLIDHSNSTKSWQREVGADGSIAGSFTHCVELVK